MKLKVENIIKNKKTYPNWTTNSEYNLQFKKIGNNKIKVYYVIEKGIKRTISKIFPKIIDCDPSFCWTLGFLKGEGSNSLGKSNYRRFTITNKEPLLLKKVLKNLEAKKIFKTSSLKENSCHILHYQGNKNDVISYWSYNLKIPKNKFKCFDDENKTSKYGICHIYLSDVLLRRVMDLINEQIAK